jgi:protein-tyrosine phosphatase
MLRAELRGVGLEVRSAGIRAPTGLPMAPHAAQVLAEIGVEHQGFESQRLNAEAVGASALILTATRSHRAEVLSVDPAAIRRIFTLREFARLTSHMAASGEDGDLRLDDLVARIAASRRGSLDFAEEDDIDDPYGGSLDVFRSCRDAIGAPVAVIAPILRGCTVPVA